jgi:hypothetical protein
LHAEVADFFNALGNIPHDIWRNVPVRHALQRFAAQFGDNAFVGWRFPSLADLMKQDALVAESKMTRNAVISEKSRGKCEVSF